MISGIIANTESPKPDDKPEMPATQSEPETGQKPQFPPNETYKDYTIDPLKQPDRLVPEIERH